MACNAVVHEVEAKPDHLLKYMEDFDDEAYAESLNKQHDLLIEILETFRKDRSLVKIVTD